MRVIALFVSDISERTTRVRVSSALPRGVCMFACFGRWCRWVVGVMVVVRCAVCGLSRSMG